MKHKVHKETILKRVNTATKLGVMFSPTSNLINANFKKILFYPLNHQKN